MKLRALIAFIALVFSSCSYLPTDMILETNLFEMTENNDYILIEPNEEAIKEGILFIPGGLVDPHAYIQVFTPFVTKLKMKVLILKVRSNLAIFNSHQANKVRKQFEENKWLIGGHSLGAVVASMSVNKESKKYEGLFLLGSYSNADLSSWDQPVFSFLAEMDGLSDLADVESNESLLPEGIYVESLDMLDLGDTHGKTIYYTIKGGNHAQFGSYGLQEGDGIATISREEQQEEFYQALTILMRNNGFDL